MEIATKTPNQQSSNEAPKASEIPAKSAFTNQKGGSTQVMQSFKEEKKGPSTIAVLVVMIVMAALGIGTGYAVAAFSATPGQKSIVPAALNPNAPAKGQTFGASDTSSFKDTAEGTLKDGGIQGEGQYHLERTGGDSQNVYLTSSSVDLSKFIGMKIKVWGATQSAQHAGWLMDVGKVEVE